MLRVIVTFALISCALAGGIYRIVNGQEGKIKDFPYLASLQHRGMVRCGASIINKRTLITATHCFEDVILAKLSVRYNTKYGEKKGLTVPVLKYLQHPKYIQLTQANDIAIVWTSEDMNLVDFKARPIKMAKSGAPLPVGNGVVAGWGRLGKDLGFPDIFHFVFLPIIPPAQCRASAGMTKYDDFRIRDSNFCAGYLGKGGKDSCKSDSGGPFVYDNTLIGVVSFGNGCGSKKFPGVYASVAFYRQWIEDNLELERQGKLVINNTPIHGKNHAKL